MDKELKSLIRIDEYINTEKETGRGDYAEFEENNAYLYVSHQLDGTRSEYLNKTVHTHNFYEAEVVYGGKGVHVLNDSSFEIKRGSVFLRSPNSIHTTFEDKNDVIRSYKLQFSQSFVPEGLILPQTGEALFAETEEACLDIIIGKIKELKAEIQKNCFGRSVMVRALFCSVIVSLLRSGNSKSEKTASRSTVVSEAVSYINKNFRHEISVNEMAKALHLNPHYLGAVFKKEIGQGIIEYALEMKLKLASRLLISTKMHVNEIASECGFSSPAYFTTKFKTHYGITPLKYRMAIK